MILTHNTEKADREERHSLDWCKRLSLVLLLATGMAFGQRWNNPSGTGRFTSHIAPELSGLLAKAKRGSAQGQTVKVIVQYREVPTVTHYATMQNRGGRVHLKLHMIRGAAFTIPVSALPLLESDPEIASVTIDHPTNVMDDLNTPCGNQTVVTNVQLRLPPLRSTLCESRSEDSNATSEENTENQWPPSQRPLAHRLLNAGAVEWL